MTELSNCLVGDQNPEQVSLWDRDAARRSLDELFSLTQQYKSSKAYVELLRFVARFRFYAPFNAMLTHVQMPGATFVAPPHKWLRDYARRIKTGARPLVILQPMGPVMFVFDVSDTEPEKNAPPLPPEVQQPFEVRRGWGAADEYRQTIENAKRDGVDVTERDAGSQSAGEIRLATPDRKLRILLKLKPNPEYKLIPLRYEVLLNKKHSTEAKYATLVHELAHLYCGHLGTPNDKWWPNRTGLSHAEREFEAESICYLVCERLGVDNPSAEYLATLDKKAGSDVPPISLECVMRSAGLIELMGRGRLPPRKESKP